MIDIDFALYPFAPTVATVRTEEVWNVMVIPGTGPAGARHQAKGHYTGLRRDRWTVVEARSQMMPAPAVDRGRAE